MWLLYWVVFSAAAAVVMLVAELAQERRLRRRACRRLETLGYNPGQIRHMGLPPEQLDFESDWFVRRLLMELEGHMRLDR